MLLAFEPDVNLTTTRSASTLKQASKKHDSIRPIIYFRVKGVFRMSAKPVGRSVKDFPCC